MSPTEEAWRLPPGTRCSGATRSFYDVSALETELERVFTSATAPRCFSLCNAFPTLFDAVDASRTGSCRRGPAGVLAGRGSCTCATCAS